MGEKYGLIVLQNGAVRGVFGSKTNEVTVGWQKLQTEEHQCWYSSGYVQYIGGNK